MQTANYPVIDGVPDCLATHNARKLYGSSLAHSGLSSVADGGLPHETGEPPWSCRCGAGRCWTARTGVGRGRQSPKAAHRLSVAGGEVEMLKGVPLWRVAMAEMVQPLTDCLTILFSPWK